MTKRKTIGQQLWQKVFLAEVSKGAMLSEACATARISKSTAYQARKKDPEFAARFEEAMEASADLLEREAKRRAVEGYDDPVFFNGEVVGYRKVYSDQLLALLLRGRRRTVFGDKHEISGSGGGPLQTAVTIATGVPATIPEADELV